MILTDNMSTEENDNTEIVKDVINTGNMHASVLYCFSISKLN